MFPFPQGNHFFHFFPPYYFSYKLCFPSPQCNLFLQYFFSLFFLQADLTYSSHSAILLGSRGVDLPHISNRLETLTTARTLQPLEALADTDIAAFLRNERENAIITAIEDSKHRVIIIMIIIMIIIIIIVLSSRHRRYIV